ncbi:hypothetical protein SUNI508_00908 [Seiridium unicorne]|uniref:BTB domain-containing protein n=1 Tax=Seiridium unicorne TaxID=138068 RepID=A0ABR2V1L7_9PEZI
MPTRKATLPAMAPGPKRHKIEYDSSIIFSSRLEANQDISYEFEPVKLQVEDGQKIRTVHIHERKLFEVSECFKKRLAHTTLMLLQDVSIEMLDSFARWIYDGNVWVEGLNMEKPNEDFPIDGESEEAASSPNPTHSPREETERVPRASASPSTIMLTFLEMWYDSIQDSNGDPLSVQDRVFARLADLYLFSTKYEVPRLQQEAILAVQRFRNKMGAIVCQYAIVKVYERVGLNDPLCQFSIQSVAYNENFREASLVLYDQLPARILLEILKLTHKTSNGRKHDPDHDWCQFHGHSSDAEHKACEERRQKDPDVRRQYWLAGMPQNE